MTQTWAPLVDVTGLSLADLVQADPDSPVGRAAARIVAGLDDPDGVISSFQSFIE